MSVGYGDVVAGGQADGEAEGEEDSGGAGEEDGVVAGAADDDAGDGAGEEEGEIDESVVGAESGAAIFDGDVTDRFDGKRWEDQGEANSDQGRCDKRRKGNPRETQQEEAEDFNEKGNDGDRKAAHTRDQTDKEKASDDETRSIDRQCEGSAAPMELREIKADERGEYAEADAAESEHASKGSNAPEDVGKRQVP